MWRHCVHRASFPPFLARVCLGLALLATTWALVLADVDQDIIDAKKPPEDGDVKIACIGDSITWGQGSSNIWTHSYPMLLKKSIGEGYWVGNYGKQSATCMKTGDVPIWDQQEFQSARAVQPNIVVIMLGTNDAKVAIWDEDEYRSDLKTMIQTFLNKESVQSVFVAMSPPVYEDGKYGIQASVVNQKLCGNPVGKGIVGKLVEEMSEPRLHLIDVFSALGGANLSHPEYYYNKSDTNDYGGQDGIHPTDLGHKVLWKTVEAALRKAGAINATSPPPPTLSHPPASDVSNSISHPPASSQSTKTTAEIEFEKAFGMAQQASGVAQQLPWGTSLSGVVYDGYYQDCLVHMDLNADGVQDDGEPLTMTDLWGRFKLSLAHLADGTAVQGELRVVPSDNCRDVFTGQPLRTVMRAEIGSDYVTPFTTLMRSLSKFKPSEDAERTLKQALKIPQDAVVTADLPGILKQNDSPMVLVGNGGSPDSSLAQQAVAVRVTGTLTVYSRLAQLHAQQALALHFFLPIVMAQGGDEPSLERQQELRRVLQQAVDDSMAQRFVEANNADTVVGLDDPSATSQYLDALYLRLAAKLDLPKASSQELEARSMWAVLCAKLVAQIHATQGTLERNVSSERSPQAFLKATSRVMCAITSDLVVLRISQDIHSGKKSVEEYIAEVIEYMNEHCDTTPSFVQFWSEENKKQHADSNTEGALRLGLMIFLACLALLFVVGKIVSCLCRLNISRQLQKCMPKTENIFIMKGNPTVEEGAYGSVHDVDSFSRSPLISTGNQYGL